MPYATPWDVSKVLNVEANAAGITGDPGDATVNFLSTIQVIDVEIPPGATLSAASGTDYFALPEPRTALPLGVVLALRGLRRSGRNHDVGRTKG